jgi:hypothetical protein
MEDVNAFLLHDQDLGPRDDGREDSETLGGT